MERGKVEVSTNPDRNFQAEFNELPFISIAWKLNWKFVDSHMI